MLQTPISSPGHIAILTLDSDKNGIGSEIKHTLERRLSKHLSDTFFSGNLNSFTSFKDFAYFSKHFLL